MKYTKRLIAFIDILGFGDLVCRSEQDPSELRLILNVLEHIRAVDDIYASPDNLFAHSNYNDLTPWIKGHPSESI